MIDLFIKPTDVIQVLPSDLRGHAIVVLRLTGLKLYDKGMHVKENGQLRHKRLQRTGGVSNS